MMHKSISVGQVRTSHEFHQQAVSGVRQLDEYIGAHERRFGGIRVRRCVDLAAQGKVCESLRQLKREIERDKRQRLEAYEHLRDTNKAMKKTIENLKETLRSCRASVRTEFEKLESANTDRLLGMNPNFLSTRTDTFNPARESK